MKSEKFYFIDLYEIHARSCVCEFKIQAINNMNNINLSTTINYDALLMDVASNEYIVVTLVYLFRIATLELPYIRA